VLPSLEETGKVSKAAGTFRSPLPTRRPAEGKKGGWGRGAGYQDTSHRPFGNMRHRSLAWALPQKWRAVTESQNHRIVGVGRDLCGSPSPTPYRKYFLYKENIFFTKQFLELVVTISYGGGQRQGI